MVSISPTSIAITDRPAPAARRPHDDLAGQSLLQELLEAVPDILLVAGEERQIVYANNAMLDGFDLQPEDLLSNSGDTMHENGFAHTHEPATDLQIRARSLRLDNQRLTVFAVKDISPEKRRRALERTFFHDVLNTAGLLQGYTELLGGAAASEIDGLRERISHLSERLVEEILAQRAVAAAEDRELIVQARPLDSAALLGDIIRLYEFTAANWGVELILHPDTQAVTFASDSVLLKRVIGNMVKNALEASQPGDTVTLMAAGTCDHVLFSVHNPVVMPRHVQLQLFQRSITTKGRGRGLGTYSMKLLTEQYLHGEVWFTSAPNAGTTFYARYPLEWMG
jgi:signal transduction histidine kinase